MIFHAGLGQLANHPGNAALTDSLVALYRTGFGNAERLYTGTEYIGYVKRPKGHPFFSSDEAVPAIIYYDGAEYVDSIFYDLVSDEIIIKTRDRKYNIATVNDKIKWFVYAGHKFVRLDDPQFGQLEAGYYEELYNGKLQAFVRHKKQINSHTVQNDLVSEYVQYDTYFIRRGEQYFRLSNNKSLIEALDQHKNEVRRFLHDHDLDFRKDPVKTIQMTVEYYDQINK